MSRQLTLGLVFLACAAVFGLAGPAAADGIAMSHRYASLGDVSTVYQQPNRPLFGMKTKPTGGDVSSKWQAVEAEIEQEKIVLTHCRIEQACPAAARALLDIVAEVAPSRPVTRHNGALLIIGVLHSRRCKLTAATVRTMRSSNMLRCWRPDCPGTI
jgi:hypothetical protein